VAKAPPTGYTFGLVGNGSGFQPADCKKLAFDRDGFRTEHRVFVGAKSVVVPAFRRSIAARSWSRRRAQPADQLRHAGAGIAASRPPRALQSGRAVDLQTDSLSRHPPACCPGLWRTREPSFGTSSTCAVVCEGQLSAFAVTSIQRRRSRPTDDHGGVGHPGFEAGSGRDSWRQPGTPAPTARAHRKRASDSRSTRAQAVNERGLTSSAASPQGVHGGARARDSVWRASHKQA